MGSKAQAVRRPLWAGLLAAWLSTAVQAQTTLEGTGYGPTLDKARAAAAADLVEGVQVQVRSEVETCVRVSGKKVEDCGNRVLQRTAAELPLLGLRYVEVPGGREAYGARAQLQPAVALPQYRARLNDLAAEVEALRAELARSTDSRAQYRVRERLLVLLQRHAEHRLLAAALGDAVPALPVTEAELRAQLQALEDRADQLDFAAQLLLRNLPGPVQRIEALATTGTREITPLAVAMTDALRRAALLPPAAEAAALAPQRPTTTGPTAPAGPALVLVGELRPLPDSGQGAEQDLQIQLRKSTDGELVALRAIRLSAKAAAGLRAEPLAPDFDRLLREGAAISSALRAELTTQVGQRNLLFKQGEVVTLVARLNRAGWFYIVGHTLGADGRQQSYLLPLQDVGRSRIATFVRYVPADQANHWLELDRFGVQPPYGTEHLQIYASSQPLDDADLPDTRFDAASNYHYLTDSQGSAAQGLRASRGLGLLSQRTVNGAPGAAAPAQRAEGTLSFTTRAE